MSTEEWELLCDHCGRCCLFKLQDVDTDELVYTNVICKLYNEKTQRCTEYTQRNKLVPTCLELDADKSRTLSWMPDTCAYRLLAEGEELPDWHPLISENPNSVMDAGIAVSGRVVSERGVDEDDLEEYVIDWVQ